MSKIDKMWSLLEKIIENYSSECVALSGMMYRLFKVGVKSVEDKWSKEKITREIWELIFNQESSLNDEQREKFVNEQREKFVGECIVAILECQNEDKDGKRPC